MSKIIKKANVLLVCLITALLVSCSSLYTKNEEVGKIIEFEKYGHAVLDITIQEMFDDGYELGDTVNIYFSNGHEFKNVPFYNGYYVKKGDIMLRAYPSHKNIAVCINYGKINEVARLKIGDTVIITLAEKAGALSTQVLNSLVYSNDRTAYSSDEEFANFREITTSGIGKGKLYRSASPINNEYKRASTSNTLTEQAGIKTVINLADSSADIESYVSSSDFNSPYYYELHQNGNVNPLSMGVDFSSSDFNEKIAKGIQWIVLNEKSTPILIHCTEGKDRAGFTSALFEAVMGASYDEIVEDYMLSYKNYYGITKENDPQRYNIIVENNINEMLKAITGIRNVKELTGEAIQEGARAYLINGGMTPSEIDKLVTLLQ